MVRSTKKIKYLDENVGAIHVQLTKEENDEIRKVVEAAEVSGPRYPEAFEASLYAETPEL
jgi:aryl-alcohol dehydrogenase-like predicted oxidoreductase